MELKLTSKNMLLVAVGGIVLVAVLLVAFVIVPRFGQIGDLNTQIAAAEQQTAQAKAILARRQEAKQASAMTQAQLLALANEMPDSPEMPSLIIELQDTANQAGLDFKQIKPSKPSADPRGFSSMSIEVLVSGHWSDMIKYLRQLSQLERKVRVMNLTVSLDGSGSAAGGTSAAASVEPTLTAQMTVRAFTLAGAKPTAAVPPASTTAPTP